MKNCSRSLSLITFLVFYGLHLTACVDAADESQSATPSANVPTVPALVIDTKDGDTVSLELAPRDRFEVGNYSDAHDTPTGTAEKAINWSTPVSVSQGAAKYFTLTAAANQRYFVTLTPSQGDPDLYLYRWNGSGWIYMDASTKDEMRVDRLSVQSAQNSSFLLLLYGYTASAGTMSATWETTDTRLDLDIPYLNQNTLGSIGPSACSSASTAMVLAGHGLARLDAMAIDASNIFAATASIELGLLGRQGLVDYLEDQRGLTQVGIDTSGWSPLYARIQSEVRAGRPLLLGSKSMSTAGHYLVVRGFSGADYNTARVIVNDPNGSWLGMNSWNKTAAGDGLEYDFTDITSRLSDGVLWIVP